METPHKDEENKRLGGRMIEKYGCGLGGIISEDINYERRHVYQIWT